MNFQVFHMNPGKKLKKKDVNKIILAILCQSFIIIGICTGAADPGGSGGPRPPLELGIYRVKFLKISKILFFL